jgi:hypothetical protein
MSFINARSLLCARARQHTLTVEADAMRQLCECTDSEHPYGACGWDMGVAVRLGVPAFLCHLCYISGHMPDVAIARRDLAVAPGRNAGRDEEDHPSAKDVA